MAAPLASLRITVGIHGEEGGATHGAAEGGDGITVAEIGAIHEFGTATVPQRSFIRAWVDEALASGELSKLFQAEAKRVLQQRATPEQAGERIALACQASVQRRIRDRIPPPLAQSTIDRKSSSVPLIDTGQLRASIRARSKVK